MSPISAEMDGNLSNEALNSSTNSNSTTGSKSILEDSNSGGSEADVEGGNFIHSTCGGSGSFGGGATFIPKGYEGIEQPTSSTENYTYGPSSVESGSKFIGTLIPNRVFVGGISCQTTESELLTLFSQFGSVRGTKIIMDRAGVSKGYGFVTFETEDEVKNLFFAMNNREMPPIVHRDRRLNIAPAVKKQQPMRPYESQGSSSGASSTSYEPFYCGQSTQGDFFVPTMLQSSFPQNATYGSQGYGVGLNSTFSPLPFDAYYYGQSNQVAAPQMPLQDNFYQQSNGFTSTSLPQAGPFYTMQNPMGMGLGQAMPGPNGTIIFSTLPMY